MRASFLTSVTLILGVLQYSCLSVKQETTRAQSETRIMGGTFVSVDDPIAATTVALVDIAGKNSDKYTPFCTGTIISKEWIVTAAHCVVDQEYYDQTQNVRLSNGRTASDFNVAFFFGFGLREIVIPSKQVIYHPDYQKLKKQDGLVTGWNDIALIQLERAIPSSAVSTKRAVQRDDC